MYFYLFSLQRPGSRMNFGGGSFDWRLKVLVRFLVERDWNVTDLLRFFPKYIWSKFLDSHFVQNSLKA